jgi:hypothetical protein
VCGEALLLAIFVELIVELLTVGRRNAVLGRDADVTVALCALVD